MSDKFLQGIIKEDNYKFTEKGAVAYSSTLNNMLDAFGTLGAMRSRSEEDIITMFNKAWIEDKALASKLLFFNRDVRGGQGERRSFRILIKDLANKYPKFIKANIDNIPFYGRYDDLLCLLDVAYVKDDVLQYIKTNLIADIEDVNNGRYPSLMAKWLPSCNTSSAQTRAYANVIRTYLHMTEKDYRKTLSQLRESINVVERYMSQKQWDKIDFTKLPSRASLIYANAFLAHETDRYTQFLKDVADGKAKINAGTLFPVDIIHKVSEKRRGYKELDAYIYDALWNNLPNYFEQTDRIESGICVVDTSGSMTCGVGKSGVTPLEVAVSLGMYCADKCNGVFKNHFITFSNRPRLQKVVGNNIFEKVSNLERADWSGTTDLEAVFNLILTTAIKSKCTQEEIPNKLYIISDMEFDGGIANSRAMKGKTFIEEMREKFEHYGYKMPQLVYWNVSARNNTFHQTADESEYCMVSGYSSSLFKSVILGTEYIETIVDGKTVVTEKLDPMTVMLNTLNSERYDKVVLV